MSKDKKRPTILIAEDDRVYLELFQTKLKKSGYNVLVSKDGKEALRVLRSKKIDLFVLDILMPVMDGYDVLKIMQKDKKLSKIRVLVLTNLGTNGEVAKKVKKMGAIACYRKTDLTIDEMAEKINICLKK